MIDRAVFSYWAEPNYKRRYSGFYDQNTLILSLGLAVKYAKQHFKEVHFHGDHVAIGQVCDHIEFDEIFDTLERLNSCNIPTYLWAYGKILTYSVQDVPFLHLDNDIFLWDKPTRELLAAPVAVECFENKERFYRGQIKKVFSNVMFGRTLTGKTADIMHSNRGIHDNICNYGIFGGNDVDWIQEYSRDIIDLIESDKNMSLLRNNFLDQDFNPIFEQWYGSIKMRMDDITPVTLQNKRPLRRSDVVKYTHLTSANKRDPDVVYQLYERGKKEIPDIVIDPYMANSNLDININTSNVMLSDYAPYEPVITKKLSFCTGAKNRIDQVKAVLRKNLNDNRPDRKDIEFILVDFGSTDGLSEWVINNFKRDLKSGYLKFYTVDTDHWHACYCKNTTHYLSEGHIVVNLDCDNFVGERGAKYVIDKFEEHDDNIVLHQFTGQDQDGSFGRIGMTREVFHDIGGYNQEFLNMGYQDWDIIHRAEKKTGVKYIQDINAAYAQAVINTKELSIANVPDDIKELGWEEMNKINKFTSFQNIYRNNLVANNRNYGIRDKILKYDPILKEFIPV